ncbi:hypothetical protein [Campylobacter sp. RM12651]|uniref:hypothetical protein n=1 Tax=Campylobacter sp. RM12651 TaxID=1660079 RepID=UPI001EFC1C42|nr:hypothetical protein [Campylobacter sp. RM12651]ULO03815.1 hypothetical protein AVBRAN_1361 [Campylobacter sp. RM12651]
MKNKNPINMQKTCVVNCIEANVMYELLIKANNVFNKRNDNNLEKMITDSKKFYKKLIALDEELERIAKSNNLKYRKGILLNTIKNSYFGEDKC